MSGKTDLSGAALTLPEAVSVPPFSSKERRGAAASLPEALHAVWQTN